MACLLLFLEDIFINQNHITKCNQYTLCVSESRIYKCGALLDIIVGAGALTSCSVIFLEYRRKRQVNVTVINITIHMIINHRYTAQVTVMCIVMLK